MLPLGVRGGRSGHGARQGAGAAADAQGPRDPLPALLALDRLRGVRVFRHEVPPLRLPGALAAALLLRAVDRAPAGRGTAGPRGTRLRGRALVRAGRAGPGPDPEAPDRHVRLQLRPAVSASPAGPAADLHGAPLCRAAVAPLPL